MTSLAVTIIFLLLCLLIFGMAIHVDRKRKIDINRIWRMPWKAVMFLALLGIFMATAHLLTLVSGRPFVGRRGW